MRKILSISVLMLVLSGCPPQKPQASGVELRASARSEGEIALQVGGEQFSVEQVQERLRVLRAALPGTDATEAHLLVVADFEVLADEAERRGYGDDPRVVNAVKDALAAAAPADAPTAGVDVDADEAALERAFADGRKKRQR